MTGVMDHVLRSFLLLGAIASLSCADIATIDCDDDAHLAEQARMVDG